MQLTIENLRELSLFKDLNEEDLNYIISISTTKEFQSGEILHYENDKSNYIYYLKYGILKFYKVDKFENEIFLYNLSNDALISEITDFEDNSMGCFANAEFLSDSRVIIIEYSKFKNLYFKNPNLLLNLMKEFSKKTKMMQCLLNREMVFDGTSKVAFMLVYEPHTFATLKKSQIAYMLNIQPETLSRILKKLVRKELIKIEGTNIEILNEKALKEIFE